MAWTTADIPDLSGKTILVTGANSGLGFETVSALAAKGARVILACRDLAKGRDAEHRVRERRLRLRSLLAPSRLLSRPF